MKLNAIFKRFVFFVLIIIASALLFASIGVSLLFFFRVREVPLYANLLWKVLVYVYFSVLVLAVPVGAVFVVRGFHRYRSGRGR